MTIPLRIALLAAALGCATPIVASAQGGAATSPDSLSGARLYTRWMFAGPIDSVWAHLSAAARAALGSTAPILAEQQRLAQWGREVELVDERLVTRNGRAEYRRTVRVSGFRAPMIAIVMLDAHGAITGWYHGKASEAPR